MLHGEKIASLLMSRSIDDSDEKLFLEVIYQIIPDISDNLLSEIIISGIISSDINGDLASALKRLKSSYNKGVEYYLMPVIVDTNTDGSVVISTDKAAFYR